LVGRVGRETGACGERAGENRREFERKVRTRRVERGRRAVAVAVVVVIVVVLVVVVVVGSRSLQRREKRGATGV
jgi:t-SNARE complex subunit (syntaxin)